MSKTIFYSNTKDVGLYNKNISYRSPSYKSPSQDLELGSLTLESDSLMGEGLAAILALAMWGTCSWQTGFRVPCRVVLAPYVVILLISCLTGSPPTGLHFGFTTLDKI